MDDNLQEARSDVESDRVGEHVDEQAQRIGILSVLVLAERIRRRHCVCVVLIAVCHKTADETAYHFFDGVRAHIDVEFRLFAEQGFDVKIQACFARLFVVVVVDAEKVRFAAVKELAGRLCAFVGSEFAYILKTELFGKTVIHTSVSLVKVGVHGICRDVAAHKGAYNPSDCV